MGATLAPASGVTRRTVALMQLLGCGLGIGSPFGADQSDVELATFVIDCDATSVNDPELVGQPGWNDHIQVLAFNVTDAACAIHEFGATSAERNPQRQFPSVEFDRTLKGNCWQLFHAEPFSGDMESLGATVRGVLTKCNEVPWFQSTSTLGLNDSAGGSYSRSFRSPTQSISCGPGRRAACDSKMRDGTDRQLDRVVGQRGAN